MALATSPGVGRPAQGFTTGRAQRWVLTAAILTAVIYAFRRTVEPAASTAPAKGGKAAALLGAGSPPPPLGQWAVAYATGFVFLSLLTLGAPELAASLAGMMVVGGLLTNGNSIATDISQLEGGAASKTAKPGPVQTALAGGTLPTVTTAGHPVGVAPGAPSLSSTAGNITP
ncbi:MAG TPA: hypothetical protein VG371_14500 [Solirubrobacteraceae bacterium]|nr:hypothetical protein [Solirubrobacteraceae bacterium]